MKNVLVVFCILFSFVAAKAQLPEEEWQKLHLSAEEEKEVQEKRFLLAIHTKGKRIKIPEKVQGTLLSKGDSTAPVIIEALLKNDIIVAVLHPLEVRKGVKILGFKEYRRISYSDIVTLVAPRKGDKVKHFLTFGLIAGGMYMLLHPFLHGGFESYENANSLPFVISSPALILTGVKLGRSSRQRLYSSVDYRFEVFIPGKN